MIYFVLYIKQDSVAQPEIYFGGCYSPPENLKKRKKKKKRDAQDAQTIYAIFSACINFGGFSRHRNASPSYDLAFS